LGQALLGIGGNRIDDALDKLAKKRAPIVTGFGH
jgi:hypothetical protein